MNSSSLKTSALLFALAATATAQVAVPTETGPWSVDVGLNYVTGDYGLAQDTDVWVQTTTINYDRGNWRFDASVPLISLSGPASVIGDVGRPDTSTARGMGDVTLSGTYNLTDPATGRSNLSFTGRVKLPTADEDKGLGTGATDFNLEANYRYPVGRVVPFLTAGYRFAGRSDDYPLEDGPYAILGAAAPLADNTTGGLALVWRERIVEGADDATEAMVFVSRQIDARWKVQGYALTGFTDASPDLGLGALVGLKF